VTKRRRPGGGRKPTPTAMKLLRGNPGKRAISKDEPKPKSPAMPQPPSGLSGPARSEWRRMAPKLHEMGILTLIDRAAFAGYCVAYARFVESSQHVRDEGAVITLYKEDKRTGALLPVSSRRNAWAIELDRAMAQMQSYLSEFGLSPSSRSRVHTTAGAGKSEDPLEAYLRAQADRRKAR